MDGWEIELKRIFNESSNIPVELKKLYSQNHVLGFNDDALNLLLINLRKFNSKYKFQNYIQEVETELERRSNKTDRAINIYWIGAGVVLATLIGILSIIYKK